MHRSFRSRLSQRETGFRPTAEKGCRQQHFALISGGFSEPDLARASRLGCTLFSKPLDMAEIDAWLDEVERSIQIERALFDWQ